MLPVTALIAASIFFWWRSRTISAFTYSTGWYRGCEAYKYSCRTVQLSSLVTSPGFRARRSFSIAAGSPPCASYPDQSLEDEGRDESLIDFVLKFLCFFTPGCALVNVIGQLLEFLLILGARGGRAIVID